MTFSHFTHKRTVAFLLIVCGSLAARAQGMTVRDFRSLPNDLTANTQGTMKKSMQDGKPAALIKVETTEKDFNFDGGAFAIVDVVQKPGEIWVYVPDRAQKITVSHNRFGVLRDYYYSEPIQSGRTYRMVLDPGVGKFASISTSTPHSTVYLDGDSIGVSPIANAYILYGKHKLFAKKDRIEGEAEIEVVNDGDQASVSFSVPMEDQSPHYGRVNITTAPDADIYMDGKILGVGNWTGELYEGSYVVETSKVNSDPQRTTFTVLPRRVNEVTATAPQPHKGSLSVYSRPANPDITIDGKAEQFASRIELPVGLHEVTFRRKGYYPLTKEYEVEHNTTRFDTISLRHVQYVTSDAFYFGASGVAGTFSGISATIGGRFRNIDLQASYTMCLDKSNPVYYYSAGDTNPYTGSSRYRLSVLGAKLGYQIAFTHQFGLTPQVGYALHMLSACDKSGDVPSGSANAACATVGARFVYAPAQRVSLFVAPEYDIAVSKTSRFEAISKAADFAQGGFFAHLGLLITF